ncbi:MAG: GNAT family N-acetyltransferase [Nocardiaceae bacterium]|nr:GNAT family N-acetyltransferase [Nocardiaceae bacterium]
MRESIRLAGRGDAMVVAVLLDAFNREFDTPTPGPEVLAPRLAKLLEEQWTFAVLADTTGFALVTLRPNVWYDGPVALLDELYVEPSHRNQGVGTDLLTFVENEVRSRGGEVLEINVDGEDHDTRRFYERHGYTNIEAGQAEPMFYYYRELG